MKMIFRPALRIGIVGIIAFLLVVGVMSFSGNHGARATYHIDLTETGFIPDTITIAKGDTVVFTTSWGKPFWPASDLHPTHTIYSEFDPKQPIDQDKSWSFRFDKVGEWQFHDHLAPLFRGRIHVISQKDAPNTMANISAMATECHTLPDNSTKQTCWNDNLTLALKNNGIAAAFDLFAAFYNSEPEFAENCHEFTHLIGEGAYEKFSNKEDFNLSPHVAYCSYGFFHGFMETMIQKTGRSDDAGAFCDYVNKKLLGRAGSVGTADACFHGIGHGVTDGSDPRARGNVFATINPGLALCEKVGRNEREVKLCGTGVFNALSGFYLQPEYKLDKSDPFWICRQQSKPYFKHACYDDLKTLTMTLADNDLASAVRFYEQIAEDDYATDAMDNLTTFAGYAILRDNTLDDAISVCHKTQKRLQVACIRGLGAGFMTAGKPDEEYKRAIGDVCGNALLTEEERIGCFERVLWVSYARYPIEKHREICATVPKQYQYHCDTS